LPQPLHRRSSTLHDGCFSSPAAGFATGKARLATDLFHQHLLRGLGDRSELPMAWRSPQQWAELVRCGAVDAVLLQSVQGAGALPCGEEGDQALAGSLGRVVLGCRPLVLACTLPAVTAAPIPGLRLLAPPRAAAPALHQALEKMQLAPVQSCACTTPRQWIARLAEPGTLLPVPADLLLQSPWSEARLTAVPTWEPLWEQLELLVPSSLLGCPELQALSEELRCRMTQAAAVW
jgi:hypothetical protein